MKNGNAKYKKAIAHAEEWYVNWWLWITPVTKREYDMTTNEYHTVEHIAHEQYHMDT